jgi:hypothetical protein
VNTSIDLPNGKRYSVSVDVALHITDLRQQVTQLTRALDRCEKDTAPQQGGTEAGKGDQRIVQAGDSRPATIDARPFATTPDE